MDATFIFWRQEDGKKKGWTRTTATWQEQQGRVKFQSSLSEFPLDMMLLSLVIVENNQFLPWPVLSLSWLYCVSSPA